MAARYGGRNLLSNSEGHELGVAYSGKWDDGKSPRPFLPTRIVVSYDFSHHATAGLKEAAARSGIVVSVASAGRLLQCIRTRTSSPPTAAETPTARGTRRRNGTPGG